MNGQGNNTTFCGYKLVLGVGSENSIQYRFPTVQWGVKGNSRQAGGGGYRKQNSQISHEGSDIALGSRCSYPRYSCWVELRWKNFRAAGITYSEGGGDSVTIIYLPTCFRTRRLEVNTGLYLRNLHDKRNLGDKTGRKSGERAFPGKPVEQKGGTLFLGRRAGEQRITNVKRTIWSGQPGGNATPGRVQVKGSS